MQPYRTLKPHDPASCRLCAPMATGHPLCQRDGCGELATLQVKRHATAEEYDATPENHKPIDGVMHQAAFACEKHGEDLEPFCSHAAPEPVPCPKCQATGTDPCVKNSGKRKSGHHQVRIDVQLQPAPCNHAHRENCLIFEGCECSQDDEPPVRPPRVVAPPPPPGPAPLVLPTHGPMLQVLTDHGIDIDRVIHNELQPKGDGSNVMVLTTTMVIRQANGDLAYDEHGKPRTETRQIELAIPRPTDPVDPGALPTVYRPPAV